MDALLLQSGSSDVVSSLGFLVTPTVLEAFAVYTCPCRATADGRSPPRACRRVLRTPPPLDRNELLVEAVLSFLDDLETPSGGVYITTSASRFGTFRDLVERFFFVIVFLVVAC